MAKDLTVNSARALSVDTAKDLSVDSAKALSANFAKALSVDFAKDPSVDSAKFLSVDSAKALPVDAAKDLTVGSAKDHSVSQLYHVRQELRAQEVMKDLERVESAVKDAQAAVKSIRKQHLVEVRSKANPPPLIKMALESVCILRGESSPSD